MIHIEISDDGSGKCEVCGRGPILLAELSAATCEMRSILMKNFSAERANELVIAAVVAGMQGDPEEVFSDEKPVRS